MNQDNKIQNNADQNIKYRILVVDDEVDAEELFITLLGTVPEYKPFAATNGIEALKILENNKIDLVLLDIVMPQMDGIQALEEIRKNPKRYGNPVIVMLTNLGGETAIEKAKKLNADGFILKIDTEPEELLNKIKIILEKDNKTLKAVENL